MSTDEAVRAYYRDRLTNDPEALRSWFSPNAQIAINGSDRAGGQESSVMMPDEDMDDAERLTAFTNFLVGMWRVHDYEILSVATEDNRAATRVLVDCECIANGRRARTEISHFFVFDGDLITSIVEFIDTAHAARILEGVEVTPSPFTGQVI